MKLSHLISVATLLCAQSVSAATLRLDATALPSLSGDVVSDFSITFEDTGDGLLDISEILNFSGASFLAVGRVVETFLEIHAVPLIEGFTNGSGDRWAMGTDMGGTLLATTDWQYQISTAGPRLQTARAVATVPVPGAGLMLLAGVAGIGLAGRRRAMRRT